MGYPLEIDDLIDTISEASITAEECREVREILNMCNDIQWSYENLDDKDGLDETKIVFKGFDAHVDKNAFFYTSFYLRDPALSAEFLKKQDGDLEHGPKLSKYKDMLNAWKNIKDRKPKNLTRDQIQSIVKIEGRPI